MTGYVVSSDLHFTDHPDDHYRFEIFETLEDVAAKEDADAYILLGDITDRKNHHSSYLVNSIINGLRRLASERPVYILKGNHDYEDPNWPYLAFVNDYPNVRFITEPEEIDLPGGAQALFLPHSFNPAEEWESLDLQSGYHYIFFHQTVTGVVVSSGTTLEGIPKQWFDFAKKADYPLVLSGDIHEPQTVGGVTYVGSPHHVHFGDDFTPRVLVVRDGNYTAYPITTIRRQTLYVTHPEELYDRDIRPSDQVKIRLVIAPENWQEWPNYKTAVEEEVNRIGAHLHGVEFVEGEPSEQTEQSEAPELLAKQSPEEIFERFCEKEGIQGFTRKIGKKLLDGPQE